MRIVDGDRAVRSLLSQLAKFEAARGRFLTRGEEKQGQRDAWLPGGAVLSASEKTVSARDAEATGHPGPRASVTQIGKARG